MKHFGLHKSFPLPLNAMHEYVWFKFQYFRALAQYT
jgi:hypothetical protein